MAFADLILTGARIYTGDPHHPWAGALAVAGGSIVAFDDEVTSWIGDSSIMRDLEGAFVMPGFVDVHNHHALAGRADLFELSFSPALSLDEVLAKVAAHATTLPADAWLTGASWGSGLLPQLNTADALARLDAASAGHPVVLSDDSHHNRWVNSAAMTHAGIDDRTVAPGGGVIMRDPTSGTITGVLLESAGIAVAAAAERVAPLDEAAHRACSSRGIEILSAFGITAFQDAATSLPILRALAQLDDESALNAWVVSSMTVNDPIFGFEPVGGELILRGEDFRREHHRPDFVKIFLDGVPPARTGAFLDPYLPDDTHGAHFRGETTIASDELYDWLRMAVERGLSAKVHCTGDASARAVLDAVERLRAEGFCGARFQIAHGQFLADEDLPRLAALGVSADTAVPLVSRGDSGCDSHRASRGSGGTDAAESLAHRPRSDRRGRIALAGGRVAEPVGGNPGSRDPLRPPGARAWHPVARAAITLPEAITVFTPTVRRPWGSAPSPEASRSASRPTSSCSTVTPSRFRSRRSSKPVCTRPGSPVVSCTHTPGNLRQPHQPRRCNDGSLRRDRDRGRIGRIGLSTRRLIDAGRRVLLLEAGGPDTNPMIHDMVGMGSLWHGPEDWDYYTVPQPHAHDRRLHLPRGKVLGGSHSLNAAIWVRGAASDFDGWAADGCAGWSWRDALPVFQAIENYDGGPGQTRGVDGPLDVVGDYPLVPIQQSIIDAAVEIGLTHNPDYNDGVLDGVSQQQITVRNGSRLNTYIAYVRPIEAHPELTIRTGAWVHRVLFEGTRAVGVEYEIDGEVQSSTATDIVLAAGALDSPRILLRSGVGPADELTELGIEPLVDLPGVGKNLHDHLLSPVIFTTDDREIDAPQPGVSVTQTHLFWRSNPELSVPDTQPINFSVPMYQEGTAPGPRAASLSWPG